MKRYCTKCEKEFDFNIRSVTDLDNLVCPECGEKIGKESRKPRDPNADNLEETIGRGFAAIFRFAYIFYMVLGSIGVVSFILHEYYILYPVTLIALVCVLLQVFTGTFVFQAGMIFLPVGAVVGYLIFNSVEGMLFGIDCVFVIRHLIRDVILRLLGLMIPK